MLVFAPNAQAEKGVSPEPEHFLQYGAGFATEILASPGSVCTARASAPCVLGSAPGFGLEVRFGYRARDPFFVGGAYEFSRQDSSNLLRLAVLQQLRAEARYYLLPDARLIPYLGFSAGAAVYGNEWGADAFGIVAGLGVGGELQISRTSVVGASITYRPLVFHHWEDGTGQVLANDVFGFGMAHFVSLDLVFEVRDPLSRW